MVLGQFEGYRVYMLRKNAFRREAGVSTPALGQQNKRGLQPRRSAFRRFRRILEFFRSLFSPRGKDRSN
jgi:hypothetical protein